MARSTCALSGREKLMFDWQRNKQLLFMNSSRLIDSLYNECEQEGDSLAAIGFVFEFGRGQLEFDLCANTSRNAKATLEEFRKQYPNESTDEFRWNSGDFDYPSAISDRFGGFCDEWLLELRKLNQLAERQQNRKKIYEGIVEISCHVIRDLVVNGIIRDGLDLDFNVADLLDDIDVIVERDKYIRSIILDAR